MSHYATLTKQRILWLTLSHIIMTNWHNDHRAAWLNRWRVWKDHVRLMYDWWCPTQWSHCWHLLPCPALPCPALPCPALPCPALPCPALPCPALPCPALPGAGALSVLQGGLQWYSFQLIQNLLARCIVETAYRSTLNKFSELTVKLWYDPSTANSCGKTNTTSLSHSEFAWTDAHLCCSILRE